MADIYKDDEEESLKDLIEETVKKINEVTSNISKFGTIKKKDEDLQEEQDVNDKEEIKEDRSKEVNHQKEKHQERSEEQAKKDEKPYEKSDREDILLRLLMIHSAIPLFLMLFDMEELKETLNMYVEQGWIKPSIAECVINVLQNISHIGSPIYKGLYVHEIALYVLKMIENLDNYLDFIMTINIFEYLLEKGVEGGDVVEI